MLPGLKIVSIGHLMGEGSDRGEWGGVWKRGSRRILTIFANPP